MRAGLAASVGFSRRLRSAMTSRHTVMALRRSSKRGLSSASSRSWAERALLSPAKNPLPPFQGEHTGAGR